MYLVLSNYGRIIFSSVCIYFFVILAIRVFGKKELAQLSVVDLVFILLISNSVQNAMVGTDSSLGGGIVAALSLFIVNYIFKFVMYRSSKIERFIEGHAILLIYKGNINHDNLKKAKVSPEELMEAIREHGFATPENVDLAVLEVDGNISVLSHEFKVKTTRRRKSHKIINKNTN